MQVLRSQQARLGTKNTGLDTGNYNADPDASHTNFYEDGQIEQGEAE
jgi:hypothetical protein